MVVKVYISGISGNKEVKKRQQRVLMILDSKTIKYDVIDITEPGRETDKDFMQNNAKSNGGTVSDPNPRSPLPPQLFNDDEYCGDYDGFDLANEVDTLEQFLKVELPPDQSEEENKENTLNGDVNSGKAAGNKSKESSQEREAASKEGTPAKDEGSVSRGATPAKDDTAALRGATPAKDEAAASREATPAKDEGAASREATPAKDSTTSKEPTPSKESSEERSVKESPPNKEASPETQSSPEKASGDEAKEASKESSPEKDESVNENGTVSSRDQSEEKEAVEPTPESKKDASEVLIETEQAASKE